MDKSAHPLLLAAKDGYVEEVERLLNDDPDSIDERDKDGRTALHWGARSGGVKIMLALHNFNADINAVSKTGIQPLHDACLAGNSKAVQLLIALGADLQAKIKDGWTPLLCAAGNGHTNIVHQLLSSGVDDELQSTECGVNALHIAAWTGHDDIVELLLKLGYDASLKSQSGKTASEMAEEEGHIDCVTLLRNFNADPHCSVTTREEIKSLKAKLRRCKQKLSLTRNNMEDILAREREKHQNEVREMKKKQRSAINQLKSRIIHLQHQSSSEQLNDKETIQTKRSSWGANQTHPGSQPGSPTAVRRTNVSRRKSLPSSAEKPKRFPSQEQHDSNESSDDNDSAFGSHAPNTPMFPSKQRASLTQLHMESLLNPDSMAYLRKIVLKNSPRSNASSPINPIIDKKAVIETIPHSPVTLRNKVLPNKLLPKIEPGEAYSPRDDMV